MYYEIRLKSKAIKDLKKIPKREAKRIADSMELLANDLEGDVKKLTNYTPEYRLRVGKFRILFGPEDNTIFIYRILHRKEAYR